MTDSKKAIVAQTGPYILEMEPGTYYWCACGRSQTQPFCDGSHSSTDIEPVEFVVERKRKVAFCGCKYSKRGALCDGSHSYPEKK